MFKNLPGFREFYPQDCSIRNHIFNCWRLSAKQFGFLEYDAPVLEPLELFTEKSGEEIKEQLFCFEDRGGRAVALRPEMTPSLARLVGAKANALPKPIKWFNIGEHFRYERPQKGRLRSFYQFNVDILGEEGPGADAEIIGLLINTLQRFGLGMRDFKVRLSDRDLWVYFLEDLGIDAKAAQEVLLIVDKLEREKPDALVEKLKPFFGTKAKDFLKRVHELVDVKDLDGLEAFCKEHPKATERLDSWKSLLGKLEALGLMDYIKIDLGIVRGLAYYTGFVFEAFEFSGKGRALAGGGRYDHLVKKLCGGKGVPATGFAMGDVTLRDLLEDKGLLPNYIYKPELFAVFGDEASAKIGLSDVARLREAGLGVEYVLKDMSFNKQFKQATQLGASFALIYGTEELEKGVVKVKDLNNRTEKDVPQAQLVEAIFDFMDEGIVE
tara:strand:- start:20178 stop:21494 length:1317 start_codon:yes stop_codon:yes gene_type:complete